MLFFIAPLAAATIAYQPPHHRHLKKKHHGTSVYDSRATGKDPGVVAERALRRRTVRLARIAYFERREAQLTAFLLKTHTETPAFDDASVAGVGSGVTVGPTAVTVDFLGSATIRTRVRNGTTGPTSILITATLRAGDGTTARASTIVTGLAPLESRKVELACPQRMTPFSITWSATGL
jgi:hypothetical protein